MGRGLRVSAPILCTFELFPSPALSDELQDMWVDQCLKRFVQAERHLEPKLLMEAHCDPDPGSWVRVCQRAGSGVRLDNL